MAAATLWVWIISSDVVFMPGGAAPYRAKPHLPEQMLRMEAEVILNKGCNEIVAVVISGLNTQRQRPVFLTCGFSQHGGL